MPAPTAAERRAWASVAANERWAKEPDRAAATQAARDAFIQKFYDQVDPDRALPPEERHKRAMAARSAFYARIRANGLKAKRLRAEADELDGGAK